MAGPTYPVFYWRDVNSKVSIYADVNALIANKPGQCLQFNDTTMMIEAVQKLKQKNTTDDPSQNADGVYIINKQPNGLLPEGLIITGHADSVGAFSKQQTLESFHDKLDVESAYHKWGIFGFWYPDAPIFTLDPINEPGQNPPAEKGYTIKSLQWNHAGAKGGIIPFTLVLSFGGRRP